MLTLSKGHGRENLKFCAKLEETEYHDENWALGKIILATLGKTDSNNRD